MQARLRLFRWFHLAALNRRRLAAALTTLGIALGVSLMVASAILYMAIGRPFSSLAERASAVFSYQATPRVQDRLPESVYRTIREDAGVRDALPFVGGLTTFHTRRSTHGALLVGSDCRIEKVIGGHDCAQRLAAANRQGGRPVFLSPALAASLGARPGTEVALPGGKLGDAYVAGIVDDVPDADTSSVNGGYWAVAPVPVVQDLLVTNGPYLSAVFFNATPSTAARLSRQLDTTATATVAAPGNELGAFLALSRSLMGVAGLLTLAGGILIGATTFAISLDERRKSFATTTTPSIITSLRQLANE